MLIEKIACSAREGRDLVVWGNYQLLLSKSNMLLSEQRQRLKREEGKLNRNKVGDKQTGPQQIAYRSDF